MKYQSKTFTGKSQSAAHEAMVRRQKANFERFMQEKAGVFQVTEGKDQALFWAMN